MRYKCAGVNQDEVNADLRARFGETCTRTQILDYREETGIDPRWIRKGSACNIGRGLYRIPGGTGEPVAPRPVAPRPAKREKVTGERSVIPSPFDDGAYDEPESVTSDELTGDSGDNTSHVTSKPKRGRKAKAGAADDPQALHNQSDYDPSIGERAKPVFIHAWICPAENCPGRKPGSFYPEGGGAPKCECGTEMVRHSWAKKAKVW
jgi:hypothetical protein